jgi:hypothetical protein
MVNLIDDLSTLTTVSKTNLMEMVEHSESILCHALLESIKDKDDYAEIDVGVGTLFIKSTDDGVKYKFIPSQHLSSVMNTTVRTKRSPLSLRIDETLGKRIMNTYKDMF